MVEIIDFSAAGKTAAKSGGSGGDRLILGNITFTCVGCGSVAKADFATMIFKSVEFHCLGCGMLHKFTNPAFAAGTARHPPRRT